MRFSFDTNVLVYATDRSAGQRQAAAVDLLQRAASSDCALTEQSLVEYLNIATLKARQPLEAAARVVREWLQNFPLLVPTTSVVRDTLAMLAQYRLSIWDARLLAVCAVHDCRVLLSEDLQDNAVYGGVRVLNPFNLSNTHKIAELLQP